MSDSIIDQAVLNNKQYAAGESVHDAQHPGEQAIQPAKRLAVVSCMDARIDVEDLLGLNTGDAHIIRNAGGVVTEDALRSLIISHHLLNTQEVAVIHHTRCGMLAFTDDLLRAGLEGDQNAKAVIDQVTGREFTCCHTSSASPSAFHAFRGELEPLDTPKNEDNIERLELSVRRNISAIVNHPWIPTTGEDAITVRGFIYDVDSGELQEVSVSNEAADAA